jgi:hypothetical protein
MYYINFKTWRRLDTLIISDICGPQNGRAQCLATPRRTCSNSEKSHPIPSKSDQHGGFLMFYSLRDAELPELLRRNGEELRDDDDDDDEEEDRRRRCGRLFSLSDLTDLREEHLELLPEDVDEDDKRREDGRGDNDLLDDGRGGDDLLGDDWGDGDFLDDFEVLWDFDDDDDDDLEREEEDEEEEDEEEEEVEEEELDDEDDLDLPDWALRNESTSY